MGLQASGGVAGVSGPQTGIPSGGGELSGQPPSIHRPRGSQLPPARRGTAGVCVCGWVGVCMCSYVWVGGGVRAGGCVCACERVRVCVCVCTRVILQFKQFAFGKLDTNFHESTTHEGNHKNEMFQKTDVLGSLVQAAPSLLPRCCMRRQPCTAAVLS